MSHPKGHTAQSAMTEKEFESIFHEFYPLLCRFATGFITDTAAVEDIVQNSFTKLWHNPLNGNHPVQVKVWLYRVVRNACLDWLKKEKVAQRKHQGQAYFLALESEGYKLQEMIRAEVMEEIYRGIETLPPACRKVFEMFYFEGKSLNGIADELGLSVHTIKNQKSKALSTLRGKISLSSYLIILAVLNQ